MANDFDPIAEIEALHTFFERWFTGVADRRDGVDRVRTVLGEDFQMISPTGQRRDRESVIEGIKESYGANRNEDPPFEIKIRSPTIRDRTETVAVVTYEEWQRGQSGETGRTGTEWFQAATGTPNGCRWHHLHETWLEH